MKWVTGIVFKQNQYEMLEVEGQRRLIKKGSCSVGVGGHTGFAGEEIGLKTDTGLLFGTLDAPKGEDSCPLALVIFGFGTHGSRWKQSLFEPSHPFGSSA